MRLSELRSDMQFFTERKSSQRRLYRHGTISFEDCDLWMGKGSTSDLDSADVTVEYDYAGPSHSDHPYGSGTAREYHPSSVDIIAVTLDKDTNLLDDNGDVIGKLPAGTDLTGESWWKAEWSDWFIEKISDQIEDESDEDYDIEDRRDRDLD